MMNAVYGFDLFFIPYAVPILEISIRIKLRLGVTELLTG